MKREKDTEQMKNRLQMDGMNKDSSKTKTRLRGRGR